MSQLYLTPAMLRQSDTGIDWDSIVQNHDDDSVTMAEISNLCLRASELCDLEAGQVLRATTDTEQLDAPSDRCTPVTGARFLRRVRAVLSRWPVTSIVSIGVAPAESFPWTFQQVPAGHWGIRNQSADINNLTGSNMIEFEAGWVDWAMGREGYVVQIDYVNGWPNAILTGGPYAPGNTSLQVDDVTGCAGEVLTIVDGAATEIVTCSATSGASGAGTLTTSPVQYAHQAGVIITALPSVVQQAAIYYAADIALSRGATTIGLKPMGGAEDATHQKSPDFKDEADAIMAKFKRVI